MTDKTISNKLFTYIAKKEDLTPEMISLYNNSLIFIGDEHQIYHPLTNTTIGIGKSEFERRLAELDIDTTIMAYLATSNKEYYIDFYDNAIEEEKGSSYISNALHYNAYSNTLTSDFFDGTIDPPSQWGTLGSSDGTGTIDTNP